MNVRQCDSSVRGSDRGHTRITRQRRIRNVGKSIRTRCVGCARTLQASVVIGSVNAQV
jgi:hypothetical protein